MAAPDRGVGGAAQPQSERGLKSVDRLAKTGLVERRANPADGRSLLVGLTPEGLARLRASQVTHHAAVRELLLDRLDDADLNAWRLLEKAMPGSVSSPVWPPRPFLNAEGTPAEGTVPAPSSDRSADRRPVRSL